MLNIQSLTFHRDQLPILEQLQFSLETAEVVLIQGHNGSGKTTLMKLLCGLLPRQEDFVVSMHGQPFDPNQTRDRALFHYLGHQNGLKLELTCLENLRFYQQFSGSQSGQSCQQVLEQVGLDGYQFSPASQLSAGQKKRLALARLLLTSRTLWLLDEPYSNLDLDGIALVDQLLRHQISTGGSVIMTSHGSFVPDVLPHRIIRLNHGRIEGVAQ